MRYFAVSAVAFLAATLLTFSPAFARGGSQGGSSAGGSSMGSSSMDQGSGSDMGMQDQSDMGVSSDQMQDESRDQRMTQQQDQNQQRTASSQLNQDQVRQIQQNLNDRGINAGPVDGIMGPKTRQGIQQFQQQQGIASTGEPDQETLEYMGISPQFGEGAQQQDQMQPQDQQQDQMEQQDQMQQSDEPIGIQQQLENIRPDQQSNQ